MLKGINPIVSPELLTALCEMGHGDELVIADGNFPCESIGKNAIVIRADGHSTTDILDAVLSLIPLDTYTEKPVALMEVVKGDNTPTPAIWAEYDKLLNKYEPEHHDIERSALHFTKEQRKLISLLQQAKRQFMLTFC